MPWLNSGGDAAFVLGELPVSAQGTALGLGARSRRPSGPIPGAPWTIEHAPRSSATQRAGGAEARRSAGSVSRALCGACAAGVAILAASHRRRRRSTAANAARPGAGGPKKGWADDDDDDDEWDEENDNAAFKKDAKFARGGKDDEGFFDADDDDDDEEWDEGFNPRGAPPLVMGKDVDEEDFEDVEEVDMEEFERMRARGGDDPWGGRKPKDDMMGPMGSMDEEKGFMGSPMDEDDEEFGGMEGWREDDEEFGPGTGFDSDDSDDEDFDDFDEEDFGPIGGVTAKSRAARGFLDEDDEDWDEADEYSSVPMGIDVEDGDDFDFRKGSVFDGMDDPPEGVDEAKKIDAQELSLLYDDFEVAPRMGPRGTQGPDAVTAGLEDEDTSNVALQATTQERGIRENRRTLERMEEREYIVAAEGIAIRTLPDERSPRTGDILRQGETFTAIEAVDGEGRDQRLYLRLPDGRGWVFDDEKLYPGLPSVKLVSVGGKLVPTDEVAPVKRPLIAVIGRPNVGKSTLVNRICDIPNIHGAIAYDEAGVTRDRTYKEAEHTDDEGHTYMFEVIDTGGLVFADDPENVTFKNEIKLQIDTALREAAAAIMVVDSRTGPVAEDDEIAKYIRETYVPLGLKVVLAVAKCDRLESMDLKAAEFWGLELGEPMPICCLHGRGVWEVMDTVINRGCDGLYPERIRGEDAPPSPKDDAVNVAIVGKPNAGKSSLLNALIGEERAIVSDIPGTTTDCIDAYLESDTGNVYRFVDTAGIRRKGRIKAGTEWLSVNRAVKAVKRCDVALMVLDASEVMTGKQSLGNAYWCPDQQQRWIARQIEEKGAACVIVLTKWDAVPNKDEKTAIKFVQAIRSNLAGVGQWAEVVTVSSRTGQRMGKILEAIDKTLAAHRKRIPTPVLNEVVRDALLWKLPAAKSISQKQGRIYYAVQVSEEPPQIALFCNNPKLFGANYKTYLENKLRQDLGWFGTPIQLEWRKRSEKRALSQAEQWLGPRLQPSEPLLR